MVSVITLAGLWLGHNAGLDEFMGIYVFMADGTYNSRTLIKSNDITLALRRVFAPFVTCWILTDPTSPSIYGGMQRPQLHQLS